MRISNGAGAPFVSAVRTNVPTGTEFEDADFGPRTQTITGVDRRSRSIQYRMDRRSLEAQVAQPLAEFGQ